MNIHKKLLLGYLSVALLSGVIGLCCLIVIETIDRDFEVAAQEVLPANTILSDLRFAGLRVVSSTTKYSFLIQTRHSPNSEEVIREAASIQSGIDLMQSALSEYAQIAPLHGDDETQILHDLKKNADRLLLSSRQLRSLTQKPSSHTALQKAKDEFNQAESTFLRTVDEALAMEGKKLRETNQRVKAVITRGTNTIILIALLTCALALIAGQTISLSFSRRLKRLSHAARKLGSGELNTRIPHKSRDEMDTVAHSFNQMAYDLEALHEAIVTNKNHLDNIIDSMNDSLIVTSPAGFVRSSNRASCALLGYSEQELVGMHMNEFLGDPLLSNALSSHIEQQGPNLLNRESEYRKKDGALIPINFSATVLRDPKGMNEGLVCLAQDISRRKQAEDEVKRLVYFDALTGLSNRCLLIEELSKTIEKTMGTDTIVALQCLDLDRFKYINETQGHPVGDMVLKIIAHRLQNCLRGCDTLARIGGDKFAIILPELNDKNEAQLSAERILKAMASPILLENQEIFLTLSSGLSLCPHDGSDAEMLLKHADMAMYAAKEKGRNTFHFFTPELDQKAIEHHEIETGLRQALSHQQLCLYYQPQINVKTGAVIGLEALLRWEHPEKGLISPHRFIAVAEEAGLINTIGEWALKKACLFAKNFNAEQPKSPVTVAVNISGHQFKQPDILLRVDRILAETQINPESLELEITESVLMVDSATTKTLLHELKDRGIQLAIDDFGTGYSSLNYLKRFPIDRIKIDRSFVRDIAASSHDNQIIKAIMEMARNLNLQVLAEGVETKEQLDFLQQCGCHEIQGYYFAPPLPAHQLKKRLAALPIHDRIFPHRFSISD